jgi:hypothetical protein
VREPASDRAFQAPDAVEAAAADGLAGDQGMVPILGRRIEAGPLLPERGTLPQSYDLERAPGPVDCGTLSVLNRLSFPRTTSLEFRVCSQDDLRLLLPRCLPEQQST